MLSRCFLRLQRVSQVSCPIRCFLPQSYYCNERWEARLSHDAFKNVSARDMGLSILQTISSKGSVSALDYDVFVNKLHELDVTSMDFIESIIDKYSHTQCAVDVVDSTSHAIVRAYVQFGRHDRLLKLAQRRSETGVFLDSVSANLLLDHFIDEKDWTSAVAVVWELCLQDYFSPFAVEPISAVTLALALQCTIESIILTVVEEPVDTDGNDKSQEIEYKFVKYVRNPNYDNFFDIRRPRLRLGFTLLQLSDWLSLSPNPLVNKYSCMQNLFESKGTVVHLGLRLFGLAYADKLGELAKELQLLTCPEQLKIFGLSVAVLEKLRDTVNSVRSRPNDSHITRGESVLPTEGETEICLTELQRLTSMNVQLSEDFLLCIHDFINEGILKDPVVMTNEIQAVEQLYDEFQQIRDRVWKEHLDVARRSSIINQAKTSLRSLLDEEERLTYFKRQNEVAQLAWLAPRTRKERHWSRMKDWRRDIEKQQEQQVNARNN